MQGGLFKLFVLRFYSEEERVFEQRWLFRFHSFSDK